MGSDLRPYKSRKIRPCDRCRKRRSRCIIEQHGPCQLCARKNVSCEFTDKVPPINRHKAKQTPAVTERVYLLDSEGLGVGNQTEDQIADLSSSREFSSNAPELSSYTYFSTSLSGISPTQSLDKDAPDISVESAERNDDLTTIGKNSSAVLIQTPNTAMRAQNEDEVESDECKIEFAYLYGDGYMDPFLLYRNATLPGSHSEQLHLKMLETSCQPKMQIIIEEGTRSESNNTELEIKRIHYHRSTLFELFLKHVNTHFPVVSPTSLQKLINQNSSCFLLLTALVLATDIWQKDPKLTLMERPNVDLVVSQVTQSILSKVSHPSLAALQSSLLLSQKLYQKGPGIDGTFELAILSVAYTFAQSMGINLDCSQWNISLREKGIRRRLWWTLYIQEKWFSFSLGRRSHISKADWDVCLLTESDFENEPLSENNEEARHRNKCFCLMAELTQHIDDIACESDEHTSLEAAYKKAGLQLETISNFESEHSNYLELENSRYPESPTAAVVIASVTAKATIYKSVLHRILLCEQQGSSTKNDDREYHSISKEAKRRSILLCAEILDILGRLRPYHFDSFWYSWARFNFATISSFFLLLELMASQQQQEEEAMKLHMKKLQFFIQSRLPMFNYLELASRVLDLNKS
ncbi:hypothetical protein KL910_002958 [Ogataea haglerorum]|nr:hypothetical protein KL910_002958 [Ogataea haglerorum]KAG7790285.1 hypothetical protein KL945_001166 [Ogataea haglerorum]